MAVRIIRPGEYGAVIRARIEPAIVERRVIEPPNSVKLDTGEYVSKSEFGKLTSAEQAFIKKHGVTAFNIEQERVHGQQVKVYEEAVAFVERQERQQEKWYRQNIVEVGPEKETVLRTAYEAMTPDAQVLMKEVGVTEFNRRMEVAKVEFETAHTQLPDKQWIDNEQLNVLKDTSPQIYEALTTSGFAAVDRIIQKRQKALTDLKDYKIYPFSAALMYEAVKAGQYTVSEITAMREEGISGYDITKYLIDTEDTKVLIAAGFDPKVVANLNTAVVATKGYWTPDNKLDIYAAYIGGVDPKHLETLTGKKEEDIKGVAPTYREFLRSYEVTHPKPETVWWGTYPGEAGQWQKDIATWTKEVDDRYEELYGTGSSIVAKTRLIAAAVFLPARALEPTVKIGDIKWWEWTIGGVQIAAYSMPLWLPQVAKVLRPLTKIERLARTAGNARLRVNIAREEMLARAWSDPSYARFASNLQHQIQASMKADKVFLNQLAALSKITPQQLTSIGRLSGIKGLASSIEAVGKARIRVVNAWNVLDKSKYYTNPTTVAQRIANENYLTRLGILQTAQNNLASALARASGTMTPVYQLGPMAGWSNVISSTEKEIAQLTTEMAKAEVAMGKAALPSTRAEAHSYWLDIKSQLASAQARLETYQIASAAGKMPPDIARYLVVTQTPTQASIESLDKMLKEVDDWLKGEGAYKPVVSPESMAGSSPVATAVRTTDKIVVPKAVPKTELLATYTEVATKVGVKTPAVVAPAKVSVFPGIFTPRVKVTTRTTTETVPAERIGAMTPEQARRLYGAEIQVTEAVSPYLITTEAIKPAEWLSPAQAIKAAQQIAIQSYVQQIAQAAIQLATRLKAQEATRAAIQSATQQAIQNQVKAIADPALQTQVLQAVESQTAVKQIVTTGILPKVPPAVPVTPIIPLIPEGKKRKWTPEEAKGAIAWKQGFLWLAIKRPYRSTADVAFFKKLPPGVTKVKGGPKSAYRSIQAMTGKAPTKLLIDMGIMDITVKKPKRTPGKAGAISFKQDIEQKTKGDITIEPQVLIESEEVPLIKTKKTNPRARTKFRREDLGSGIVRDHRRGKVRQHIKL